MTYTVSIEIQDHDTIIRPAAYRGCTEDQVQMIRTFHRGHGVAPLGSTVEVRVTEEK